MLLAGIVLFRCERGFRCKDIHRIETIALFLDQILREVIAYKSRIEFRHFDIGVIGLGDLDGKMIAMPPMHRGIDRSVTKELHGLIVAYGLFLDHGK